MKLKSLFFGVLILSSISGFAQTLYVPSGTGGIGSSTTSNVGIGISNPSEKLQINGSVRGNQQGALRISTGSGYIDIGPKNTSFAHFFTDKPGFYFDKEIRVNSGYIGSYNSDLFLRTSGSTKMTIKTNGKIGIGTTNPLEALHVNGNLLIPSDKSLKIGSDNPNTGCLSISNVTSCYNTYADFKGNLYFRHYEVSGVGKGSVLALQQDGTVVINNWELYEDTVINTMGHKLMVNGKILCMGIKCVTQVPTSDYVFEKDYKLMDLNDVEKFVKEKKHLPEVPSSQDFKENGYNMGEFDDIMLRKVEELTLYIIEQNKKISELQEQINSLKK